MNLPDRWSEAAYMATLRVLRKSFRDEDLVFEAAAERWLEILELVWPPLGSVDELIGLCLTHVMHRALDLLRKQRGLKRRWAPLDEVANRPVEPARQEIRAQLWVQERCLDQMPPRQREVVRLYYLTGLSDREIAWRRVRKARLGRAPSGAPDQEKARVKSERRRAIERARKSVNCQRWGALDCLRRLIQAELAREECPAA
jgi:RNA polymerase sigma factor (sigma-70 family)